MKSSWEQELDEVFEHVDPAADATARLALEIAIQLVALRERRGLTRQDLAARLGTSPRSIVRIEDGLDIGGALARLNEAVLAMDAVLDITVVPREDLAAYQARQGPKPILTPAATEALAANDAETEPAAPNIPALARAGGRAAR